MDMTTVRKQILGWISKYRWVLLVLVIGVVLMLIPVKEKDDNPAIAQNEGKSVQDNQCEITSESLEEILSSIRGAGEVEVLLTCAASEQKVYQTDEHSTISEDSNSVEKKTVILSGENRTEEPLVAQIRSAEYLGAVVVCQGADDPAIRLALSDAVSKATGLKSNQISVLKMK